MMAKKIRLKINPIHNEEYDANIEEVQFGNEYMGKDNFVFNSKTKSILPYLKDYQLPDNIKQGAEGVYNQMKPQVRRAKNFNILLYYCVYYSYLEEIYNQEQLIKKRILIDGKDYIIGFDPIQLGKLFNLTKSDIQKGDSLLSPLQTGYKPKSSYLSMYYYLPNYCKCINLSDEAISNVLELARSLVDKDKILSKDNAQSTAAGILYYYTKINGITICNMKEFEDLTTYKLSTIINIYERISTIDNSK